jgi:hypothetical protein
MTDEADEIDVPDFVDAIVARMMECNIPRRQAKAIVSDMIDEAWLQMQEPEYLSPYVQ